MGYIPVLYLKKIIISFFYQVLLRRGTGSITYGYTGQYGRLQNLGK